MATTRAIKLVILLTLTWITSAQLLSLSPDLGLLPQQRNAFHIFNAIHSSMRQWGSSLNHNGVSFFPATVPEGTDFYHGTRSNLSVTGMEWLAFEPEHALIFGRMIPRRPLPANAPFSKSFTEERQQTLEPKSEEKKMGYFHTYTTNKELHLLYIDGMSAAKTVNGTLDSQDHVLINLPDIVPGYRDYERAKRLCHLASQDWEGRVDGFIRLEAGFEIILCNFSESLDVKRITREGSCCSGGQGQSEIGKYTAPSSTCPTRKFCFHSVINSHKVVSHISGQYQTDTIVLATTAFT
jgi:hypothetical protein